MTRRKPKVQPDDCLRSPEGQTMICAAFRYCFGRMTSAPSHCMAWLDQWWDAVERYNRMVIIRDIVTGLQRGEAGMNIDEWQWKRFGSEKYLQMSAEDRKYVQDAVAYTCRPWPLARHPDDIEENDE